MNGGEDTMKFLLHAQHEGNLPLGELQPALNRVIKAISAQATFLNNQLHDKQIAHLTTQIKYHNQLFRNLSNQLELTREETRLRYNQHRVDSTLFTQNVLPLTEYNRNEQTYLIQRRNERSMEAALISNQLQKDMIEKEVVELRVGRRDKIMDLKVELFSSINELLEGIKKWEETYVLTAPIDGRVTYLTFLEDQQYIRIDQALFSVVPDKHSLIGKSTIPLDGSGKVKAGQNVNVKLYNYPFEQFGTLKGSVMTVSLLPDEESYSARILLPDGMMSSHHKRLPFKPELHGDIEIITEDLSLFDRFFYRFRKLANR